MGHIVTDQLPNNQRRAADPFFQRIADESIDATAQTHIDLAASHLYESLRPAGGGLAWDELSSGQRNDYRSRILDARDATAVESGPITVSVDPAEDAFYRALQGSGVPPQLHDGLVRYIVHRVRPGSFLFAVLSADLITAVGRADDTCLRALGRTVKWLFTDAPARCWGSRENVDRWLAQREQKDEAAS